MTIFDLTIDGRSYDEMSSEEQSAFVIEGEKTAQESAWFEGHWLKTNAQGIADINAALPTRTRCINVVNGTDHYTGADMLTDCGDGGTYEGAATLIKALPIVEWTVVEPDGL